MTPYAPFVNGDTHPDHDTICKFRRENREAFRETFVKVLAIAGQSGLVGKVGSVSVDGTKIKANASKHAAVSCERAGKLIEQLTLEVEELERKAEEADSTPLDDGLSIPDEVSRRQERKTRLEQARQVIEERYEQERRNAQEQYEVKVAERQAKREAGKPPRGREPEPPAATPPAKKQYNFTDPDSSIMKAGNGQHFEQAYNAQASVDAEGSMMILGCRVSVEPNDKQELAPSVASIDPAVRVPSAVLADNGYFSAEQVEAVEADGGPTVYVATGKTKHGRTVADLEKHDDPPAPAEGASLKERMAHRLSTREGKATYKARKETVEPTFGVIKSVMGFRQFHLRGHPKVDLEWCLVCLAYNVRRLFRLADGTGVLGLVQVRVAAS